jgi:hypothetical protein
MPLNVGGAAKTTTLYVSPANGDGKNGCNLTGSTALSLSVSSSDAGVATVSPSSVTFTSCGDVKTLTVTPVSQGSADITVAQTANNTGGTFNLAPAKFTANVAAPANTAPGVAVAGVTAGASYEKGSVPSATCQVSDAEDGNGSFAATISVLTGPYAVDGIGSQTASCSYTDGGGLTASASKVYSIVDLTAPAITYTLDPATPDGDNGWYRGDVKVTWSVVDADSPNSLAKSGCDELTIVADQAATEYTCSATSAGGASGPVSVTVKRDGTGPLVSYDSATGTLGDNGWYTSDVTATFVGEDALSGPVTATQTASSSGEGADVVVSSPAFTDNAGNTAAAGAASHSFKIDKSAPNPPTVSVDTAPNAAGWNKSDVVVTFTADGDNGPSGVASCSSPVTVSAEGDHTVSGSCTDNAGNVSATVDAVVRLDKTKPTVAVTDVQGVVGDNGWYTSDVDVTFTATDLLSGVAGPESKTVTSSGEGTAVVVSSPAFADVAGNEASAGDPTQSLKIDQTAPEVSLHGGPSDGGSYYFGSVPAAPSCDASDTTSGLAGSCQVSGYATTVGTHVVTASAKDSAGNMKTVAHRYTVLAWTTKGFFSPVDMGGTINTVKGGSTVPLKFELFAGPTELTDTAAIASFKTTKVSCTTGSGLEDAIEVTTTGGTSLRYDVTAGQYIQNWKTPTGAGTCYSATMTALDGSSITALFKLK